jgi:dipeptidyl aminopeptidase/acylaminoacyl peptidase
MPQTMRKEYEQSSVLSRVQSLCRSDSDDDTECKVHSGDVRSKRLLLIHGLLDDNVHARHALLLLQVFF